MRRKRVAKATRPVKSTRSAKSATVRTEPLSRLVTPIESFMRSTNVERDTAGAGSLGTYIANASALDTVQRLADSMSGGGRAFSITGPYGSGKSTLAVFLGGLLGPSSDADWKYAHRLLHGIAPGMARNVTDGRKGLGAHRGGFARCTVVAGKEPISATIIRALDKGARDRFGTRYSARDFATAGHLRRLYGEIRQADGAAAHGASHTGAIMEIVRGMCSKVPVVILVDEFGKNLEYLAEGGAGDGDVFSLQSMAEAGTGPGALPLFVVTMQHMSFEEYGTRMSGAHRREWAKVQGRFEDIPFENSAEQTRLLVSRSLCARGSASGRKAVDSWSAAHMASLTRLGLADGLGNGLLASCYPLNPLALLVLPELCARYGQYERTLVSFVAGAGRDAVPAFIDRSRWSAGALPSMDVESLYDYFVSSHQSAGSASAANVTRLMEITTVIRDSHGLSRAAIKALKTIGVLNLVSTSGSLRASRDVMRYAVGQEAEAALEELEEKSIITHRAYADEYRVWRGTDVDIQAHTEILRAKYADMPLAHTLALVSPLEPMMAARHGIKTGTMRMFGRRFLGDGIDEDASGQDHDGVIMYMTDRSAGLPPVSAGALPTIVVRPTVDMEDVRSVALETAAIREMLETDDAIKGDWVARRELWDRMVHGITGTETGLERAYGDSAEWWLVNVGARPRRLDRSGGVAVSAAADIAYPKTPHAHNEMVNRTRLSTQASRARLTLINAMVMRHGEESLGMTGWGPERAMYESVLKRTGMHARSGRSWGIARPRSGLCAAWDLVMSSIARSRRHRVNVSEVYSALKAPPIGAKAGIMPILLVAALLTKRDDVALYEHGTYKPTMAPEVIERLLKNPGHFEIKHLASRTGHKAKAIRGVAAALGANASLLGVIGELVKAASRLPAYTRATKTMGKHDTAVRDTILRSTEPDVMLFEALPRALGVDLSSSQFGTRLAKSVKALEKFHPDTLNALRAALLKATRVNDRKRLATIAVSLSERATGADSGMRGFLNAIATSALDDDEWIGYVAMVLTEKPVADWTDETRRVFDTNLQDLAGRFLRLMALNFDESARHLSASPPPYRITVTNRDGTESINVAIAGDGKDKMADRVVDEMVNIMDKKGMARQDVILALMASLSKRLQDKKSSG